MDQYQKDYNSNRLYDIVTLAGGIAQAKTDSIKPWNEIVDMLKGNKADDRTDEEIEAEIMEKYNKVFRVK